MDDDSDDKVDDLGDKWGPESDENVEEDGENETEVESVDDTKECIQNVSSVYFGANTSGRAGHICGASLREFNCCFCRLHVIHSRKIF